MSADLREEIHRLPAQFCRALADPNRILILYALSNNIINVSDLAEEIGLSQPSVSRHLRVLRENDLVRAERRGHSMMYQLTDKRVVKALDLVRGMIADSLEKKAILTRSGSEIPRLVN